MLSLPSLPTEPAPKSERGPDGIRNRICDRRRVPCFQLHHGPGKSLVALGRNGHGYRSHSICACSKTGRMDERYVQENGWVAYNDLLQRLFEALFPSQDGGVGVASRIASAEHRYLRLRRNLEHNAVAVSAAVGRRAVDISCLVQNDSLQRQGAVVSPREPVEDGKLALHIQFEY